MSRLIFIALLVFIFTLSTQISAQETENFDIESLVREVLEEELQPLPVLVEQDEVLNNDVRYAMERLDDDLSITCTATTGVNVRSGPSTSHSKLGLLYSGQSVPKISTSGSWSKVTYNGRTGYVHSDYLRCSSSGGGSSGGGSSGGSSTCSRSFPLFKQCDNRWRNDKLGSSSTVCKVGCLMSSISMAMNAKGKKINGASANPQTLNSWLRSHGGYQGNLFVWGSVSSFGFSYQGKIRSHSDIKSKVCNHSYAVILNVNRGGHWVLATGVNSNGSYRVNDPGYSKSAYSTGEVVQAAVFRI
eukprot:CAMPEP_0117445440 /NCGR_PEP_ID=MMETSP0759-20121206/5797_1 /TAXON_ID=63605 /ORGANISM="Percolomonas cosmopolitus, Strain WS" /LENGTH=300 /DNA_ID=CAMNT_0005237617 /DNA_START=14 /DNA_END=916 /DNA_ORIENTATION=+